jgi:hypothetical protein
MKITGNENTEQRMKKTQQKRESQNTEIVNGVHPLHWATSPGPSPMGTDPINLQKLVHNGYNNIFSRL